MKLRLFFKKKAFLSLLSLPRYFPRGFSFPFSCYLWKRDASVRQVMCLFICGVHTVQKNLLETSSKLMLMLLIIRRGHRERGKQVGFALVFRSGLKQMFAKNMKAIEFMLQAAGSGIPPLLCKSTRLYTFMPVLI